jgi:hypothetical protein
MGFAAWLCRLACLYEACAVVASVVGLQLFARRRVSTVAVFERTSSPDISRHAPSREAHGEFDPTRPAQLGLGAGLDLDQDPEVPLECKIEVSPMMVRSVTACSCVHTVFA